MTTKDSVNSLTAVLFLCVLQLKGSDLELTLTKGTSAPRAPLNGPACAYVNLRVNVNSKEKGSACVFLIRQVRQVDHVG